MSAITTSLREDWLESQIATTEFIRVGKTTTVCSLTLKSGYVVTATSSCLSSSNFDSSIGTEVSKENALNKLWELYGFAAKQQVYERSLEDGHVDKLYYQFD